MSDLACVYGFPPNLALGYCYVVLRGVPGERVNMLVVCFGLVWHRFAHG